MLRVFEVSNSADQNQDQKEASKFSETLNVEAGAGESWKVELDVAGGRVYTGGLGGVVRAFDTTTGESAAEGRAFPNPTSFVTCLRSVN